MPTTVIVELHNVDMERFKKANEKHADTLATVIQLGKKYGMLSGQRYIRGTTVIDIDEWESETAYFGFMAEAHPHLAELAAARGTSPMDGVLWDRLF